MLQEQAKKREAEPAQAFGRYCRQHALGVMDLLAIFLLAAIMVGLSQAPQLTMQLGMLAIPLNLIYLLYLGWEW